MTASLQSGQVEIDDRFTLDGLTKEADLIAAFGDRARPLVHNAAYRSYVLPKIVLSGRELIPTAYFNGEMINAIHLAWVDPENKSKSAWEFSFERERVAAEGNATWLSRLTGGRPAVDGTFTFPWGTIWSGIDAKGGFASIVIRFNHPKQK